MNRDNNVSKGCVGICDLVFIVFLVLKLVKVIDWSWWWVTAPLWGPIALVIIIALIVTIVELLR